MFHPFPSLRRSRRVQNTSGPAPAERAPGPQKTSQDTHHQPQTPAGTGHRSAQSAGNGKSGAGNRHLRYPGDSPGAS